MKQVKLVSVRPGLETRNGAPKKGLPFAHRFEAAV